MKSDSAVHFQPAATFQASLRTAIDKIAAASPCRRDVEGDVGGNVAEDSSEECCAVDRSVKVPTRNLYMII